MIFARSLGDAGGSSAISTEARRLFAKPNRELQSRVSTTLDC
jgi:hypothetical protein